MNRRFSILLTLFAVVMMPSQMLAQSNEATIDPSTPSSVDVRVCDENGNPVPSADVEIRLWGGAGEWVPTDHVGKTDSQGELTFKDVPVGDYLTVLAKCKKFAPAMQDLSLQPGETRKITCKLLPAVEGELKILSPDGEPLKGAQVTRLDMSTDAGVRTVLKHEMFSLFAPGDYTSDESGRLKLPPLPEGSKLKATVFHEDYAHGGEREVELNWGQMATIQLVQGNPVVINFDGDAATVEAIDGQLIEVKIFARNIENGRLIHKVPVKNNQIKFTMPAGHYESLTMSLDGYLITPQLYSSIFDVDFLKLDSPTVATAVIRPKIRISGRIVDPAGKPVPQATVNFQSANLYFNEASKSRERVDDQYVDADADYVMTGEDGTFEASVPAGKSKVLVKASGFYSDPETPEFNIKGQRSLPDITIKPMPTVTGTILGPNGQPVPDGVVRIANTFGQTNYFLADDHGKFSFTVDRFPYSGKPPVRQMECSFFAFDPFGNGACFRTIPLTSPEGFENLVIKLESHEPDWLLTQLAEFRDRNQSELIRKRVEESQATLKDAFPDGKVGRLVPNMVEGTWLNTSAGSLDDFRGKYVLLDFWFIGCGPCVRDMPTVKMVQELFGGENFSVVSVHIAGQTPEQVEQYAKASSMEYPLVVDSADGKITASFESLGVSSYPYYILIDPDGKIVLNDGIHDPNALDDSLRLSKLEIVRQFLLAQHRK